MSSPDLLPVPDSPAPALDMNSRELLIPLDHLIQGGKARCGLIGPNKVQFLSTRDVIMGFYGKVWGDVKGEKKASARWNNLTYPDREQFGDDIRGFRFSGDALVFFLSLFMCHFKRLYYVTGAKFDSPVIAFHAVPKLCTLILKETAPTTMPKVVKLMQDHFTGDPGLIPDMPDECMSVDRIPFDLFTPGSSSRCTMLDGRRYLAIPDVLKSMSGKDSNYSAEMWRNLSADMKKELQPFLKEYKFSGTS